MDLVQLIGRKDALERFLLYFFFVFQFQSNAIIYNTIQFSIVNANWEIVFLVQTELAHDEYFHNTTDREDMFASLRAHELLNWFTKIKQRSIDVGHLSGESNVVDIGVTDNVTGLAKIDMFND